MSITAGAFMSDTELTELNFFTYEGSQFNLGWSGVTGWAPNYPHTNPQPGTSGGNAYVVGSMGSNGYVGRSMG